MIRALVASALVVGLAACAPGGDAPGLDAGAGLDASFDGAPRPPRTDAGSTVYAECAADDACPPGFFCDHDFPRGQCTVRCSRDTDCPESGRCISGRCFRSCEVGGGAFCRDDQLCRRASRACLAACTGRDDLPGLACASGLSCRSNYCARVSGGPSPLGSPCAADAECATLRCATPAERFPEGMCTRATRMVAADAWLAPGPMPEDRCPEGSVVGLGPIDAPAEGEDAWCLPRCVADADCRDGYYCERRGFVRAPVHDDGFCTAWLCDVTSGLPPPCPPTHACVSDPVLGRVCRRSPP